MKISKIIDELTELQEYLGDKDLESCIANDTTDGVNVMYQDEGGWTSTSLEGEKAKAELKTTMSDQEALDTIKVKVLNLDFCEASNVKHSDEMLEKLATATSIDRKEYDEILEAISAHFDRDDMDIGDCLEECQLQLKAAYAYINYAENAQLRVTKVDVVPCSLKDDPSRLADVVAVINDGLVIRGIRLYAASPSTLPTLCKDDMYISYPERIGSNIYPAAYPIQPDSGENLHHQLLEKVIERYKAMPDARTLPLSWKDILQVGSKYYVKFRSYGHPHVSMLSNIDDNCAICECVMEHDQPDVKNVDGTPYIPEKALIVKYTITSDMALKDVPYHAIPECEWDQSIDIAVPPKDGLLYLKPYDLIKNPTAKTSTCSTR